MKEGNGEISLIGDNTYPVWEQGVRQGGIMNKPVMYKNLLDFKMVMDKYQVPFVHCFGNLLGLLRCGDLIDWSKDVDFFSYAEDHYKMASVVPELQDLGFFVPNAAGLPLCDHHFIRNGEKIEIWWFEKTSDAWVYDNRIRFPRKYFDTLDTIDFLDVQWAIPKYAEENIAITYGKDWRIPNPKGCYVLDGRKEVKK